MVNKCTDMPFLISPDLKRDSWKISQFRRKIYAKKQHLNQKSSYLALNTVTFAIIKNVIHMKKDFKRAIQTFNFSQKCSRFSCPKRRINEIIIITTTEKKGQQDRVKQSWQIIALMTNLKERMSEPVDNKYH